MFSVCNHRQVTNVSGFLCRWKKRLRTAATRRTQSWAVTRLTPRRPTTHSIITGCMIAAGVSALFFCFYLRSMFVHHLLSSPLLILNALFADSTQGLTSLKKLPSSSAVVTGVYLKIFLLGWRRENHDFGGDGTSPRSEGEVRGGLRGRGKGRGRGRGRGRSRSSIFIPSWRISRDTLSILKKCSLALPGHYEYTQGFRDSRSSDGSAQVSSEFGNNMVYYYDDGSKVQMYTVDEKLLKEYIKRQM